MLRFRMSALRGKLRARGLGRDSLELARQQLETALEVGAKNVVLPPRTVFGGAKVSVLRTRAGELKRRSVYGQWFQMPTHLSLEPAPKRTADWSPPSPREHLFSGPFGEVKRSEVNPFFDFLEEIRDLSEGM